MTRILTAAIALAMSANALALSNSFSYQGSLTDAGTPANGSYDLQFQLQTSAGANVGAALLREDVSVASGVFSVELDFGAAITSADFRLQIGVRPGVSVGAFTSLAPTTPIRPTPQAQVAGLASEAVTVSPNSITSASIQDNAITANDIEDSTISSVDVDTNEIQLRVSGTCFSGTAIRTIAANGTVTCENVGGGGTGTVTNVASGAGLTGGPITSSGTLAIATGGVTSAMIADGTLANVDLAANAVNSGIVADGSIGSADINTAQVQTRVSGTCAAGSSIRTIATNGNVACEVDDEGSAGWSLTGNAATSPAANFLGTTDAVDLALRVNNQRMLLIDSTNAGVTSNWIGGYSGNTVDTTSGAQTIAGGGENETNCGLTLTANLNCDNRTNGTGATVGGGIGQRATSSYATIAGGINNEAGASAAIAGGARNQASGSASMIPGGLDNTASGIASLAAGSDSCAGGDRSFALGQRARTRPGNDAGDAACRGTAVPNSGDANGDEGSFVWADTQVSDFVSTGPNQFLVRADGGAAINTATIGNFDDFVIAARTQSGDADADLVMRTRSGDSVRIFVEDASGGLIFNGTSQRFAIGTNTIDISRWINTGANGAHLTTGGTWTNGSSRQFKDVLGAFDPSEALARVLDLSISRWRYKDSGEGEHVGPMAEDFRAAFGLGADAQHIATVDADGVALAAIQGLNQKLEAENATLRSEIEALRELVLTRVAFEPTESN